MGKTIADQGELVGICGWNGTTWEPILIDASKRLEIAIAASALPTGAATSIKQLAAGHDVTVDNVSIAVTGAFYQVTQPVSLADQTVEAGVRRLALSQAYYNGVPGDAIWHNVLSVSGPGLLVGLDIVSDHADSRLKITVDGDVIYQPRAILADVATAAWFSTINGSGGESSWMKAGVYDAANNYYSMFLKRKIAYFSTLIVAYYAGSVTAKVGISAQYRITE